VAVVAARAFFEGLEARADPAKLAGVDHSYCFVIEGEGTWNVRIHGGAVVVTEGGEDGADATIRASGADFDRIVAGKQNPATAYMRGKVKVTGDLGAVMKLQRLFS
jgi:putative sterol carrier protein